MRTGHKITIAICSLILLAVAGLGCKDDPTGSTDMPVENEYLPNTSPDNLIANLVSVFENKDADEYRDNTLYRTYTTSTWEEDSREFGSFVFHFASGVDPWGDPLPDQMSYSDEWANVARMFSGATGKHYTPGIETIEFNLMPIESWIEHPSEYDQEGVWPEGSFDRLFNAEISITLKDDLPGSYGINEFRIDTAFYISIIPVRVPDTSDLGYHREYRLWKWGEITEEIRTDEHRVPIDGSVVSVTLSEIKSMFRRK